jgi:hypothetical protein
MQIINTNQQLFYKFRATLRYFGCKKFTENWKLENSELVEPIYLQKNKVKNFGIDKQLFRDNGGKKIFFSVQQNFREYFFANFTDRKRYEKVGVF